MPKLSELNEYAKALNIPLMLFLCILVFGICLLNIDKLYIFKGMIIGLFTGISSVARKSKISNDIRGRVMRATKTYNDNMAFLPNDLKVQWVKGEDKETFLKNDRLIIRMSRKNNPHENFVNAIFEYVRHGLLYKEKIYLDSKIMEATDLSVMKKIIIDASESSLKYFHEKVLIPIISVDDAIKEIIQEIAILDGNGMFVNILINEYMKAGNRIYPSLPDECLVAESKEFLWYLHRIATNNILDISDFTFNREYFKTVIILAGKDKTIENKGLQPYLQGIFSSIDKGIDTIYLFGLGRKINIAREIAAAAEEGDLRIIKLKKHYYNHKGLNNFKRVGGICIEISVYTDGY